MITDAIFSDDGLYRHRLDFEVADSGLVVLLCGCNPSVAGRIIAGGVRGTDHTVEKWHGFGRRNDWRRGIVVNGLDRISTQVRELSARDAVSDANSSYVDAAIAEADILLPCWGNLTKVPLPLRVHFGNVLAKMYASGKPVKTFGLTKGGDPKHPLMLGYDTPIIDWRQP